MSGIGILLSVEYWPLMGILKSSLCTSGKRFELNMRIQPQSSCSLFDYQNFRYFCQTDPMNMNTYFVV